MAGDDTPWLDSEELRTWIALMGLVQTLPTALDAQLKRDAGLNLFEYHVLAVLSESPDRTLGMSQLALFSRGSASRLSHAVRRLEDAGWVERHPDPEDGRLTRAHLTPAGYRKVTRTAPDHVREARSLVFDGMSAAQVAELGRLCRRIVAAADPEVAQAIRTGLTAPTA